MIETYIPLYRKYRPQDFASLMGQSALAQTLTNAIEMGRVAHAYLFTGPRGTGKTSTARILAKSLNCEQGPTLTPCQVCASCTGITHGNALDVIEFDAASNNGVEQARELIDSTRLAPLSGRFKIYIIDEVHMLSTSAFNALLKTLEEPPPNVVFIFATTEAHKVLPTIVSRCQRFDFQRISTVEIVERLQWVCDQEALSAETEALTAIARHAKGGLRDALSLLDQVSVLARAKADPLLTRPDVLQFIGALDEDALLSLSLAIAKADTDGLMSLLSQWSRQGVEPARLSKSLMQHYRHLMVCKAAQGQADALRLDLSAPYVAGLNEQSALYAVEEIPQILHLLAQLEVDIRKGGDPQLMLEVSLLGLAFRDKVFQVDRLMARLEALEARMAYGAPFSSASPVNQSASGPALPPSMPPAVNSGPRMPEPVGYSVASAPLPMMDPPEDDLPPAPPPAPRGMPPAMPSPPAVQPMPVATMPPPPVAASASGGSTEPGGLYQAIVANVASHLTKAQLQQTCWLIEATDQQIVFGCPSEPVANLLGKPPRLGHVEQAVTATLGSPRTVSFRVEKKKEGVVSPTRPQPVNQPMPPAPAVAATVPVSAVGVPSMPSPVAVPPTAPPAEMAIDPHSIFSSPGGGQPAKSAPASFPPAPIASVKPSGMPPPIESAPTRSKPVEQPSPAGPTGNAMMDAPLFSEMVDEEGDVLSEEAPEPALESAAPLLLTGDPDWLETKQALLKLMNGQILE